MRTADLIRRAVLETSPVDWNSMGVGVSREVFEAFAEETGAQVFEAGIRSRRFARLSLGDDGWSCEAWELDGLSGYDAEVWSQNVTVWEGSLFKSAHDRLAFYARPRAH